MTFANAATGATLTVPAAPVPSSALRPLPKTVAFMADKFAQLAVMAAGDAIAASGLELANEDRTRIGVSTGSCMNGISETETGFKHLFVDRRARVHPFTLVRTMPNGPAAYVAMTLGLSGPALHYSTTCSSASVAIGEASRQIRHGYADTMIAGGTETLLTYSAVSCWQSAGLLARVADDPARSCRPFDATRDGAVLGEGSAFVVLEELEAARRRAAPIVGEVVGYACSADSQHVAQPSSDGQAACMRAALADSGIDPGAVGYIHAHGTGTKQNDSVETKAIRSAFGAHADKLAVSSSKSMVGHMIGAAGAFGFILCVKALESKQLPPTANLRDPDPDCDLDYVPNVSRRDASLRVAMVNAFGFGGTSASLLVRAVS